MPDMKEKLVKLLGGDMCKDCSCYDCEHENNEKACIEHIKHNMADHLIANGVTIRRWIPVKKEPHSYDVFIATMQFPDGERVAGIAIYNEDGSWIPEYEGAKVTHWMDFPEPPKEDE